MNCRLTIIYCYRNRDLLRMKRSFDSLSKQTTADFKVLLVDYGSELSKSAEVKNLLKNYPFAKYIYNDTRGMPWNRSHCLNTGIRLAETDFVFTADIDMIFETNFVEILLAEKKENEVTFFSINYLPENFSDWNNSEIKIYERSKNFALGLALLPVKILNELHGYDEFYCFWGQEDNDMQYRLEKAGVQTKFYDTSVLMHHQWHPSSTASEKELPAGWRVFQNDYFNSQKESITRNEEKEWGKLFAENERISLKLINDSSVEFTKFNGSTSFFIYELNRQFKKINTGTAIAFEFDDMNSAAHLQSRLGKTISSLQSLFNTLRIPVTLVSQFRHLYTTVYQVRDEAMVFILAHPGEIADYSLLMKDKKLKIVIFKK